MATQNIHRGNVLQVFNRIALGPPAVYQFLCMATTKSIKFATTLEDATVYDCDDPSKVPVRKSIPRQRMAELPISGKVDALRFATIRLAEEQAALINMRILVDLPLAQGGGYWQGDWWIESLEIGSTDNGIITFAASFKSDGLFPWTNAAS